MIDFIQWEVQDILNHIIPGTLTQHSVNMTELNKTLYKYCISKYNIVVDS